MPPERSTWCLLYVEAPDEQVALDEMRAFLGAEDDDGRFQLPVADLEVRRAMQWPGPPDDYEGWRALVEVDIKQDVPGEAVIDFIGELMVMFRSHGHRVVAELESFEDGLPQQDLKEILARERLDRRPTTSRPVVVERTKRRWWR